MDLLLIVRDALASSLVGSLATAMSAREAGRPAVLDVVCDFTPHPMDAFWVQVVMAGINFAPAAG